MPIFNDINLKDWKESEVWTDSLWLISERDKTGKHSGFYHGNFVPQIPRQFILRYTKKSEVVFDPFVGSGTTAYEAENLKGVKGFIYKNYCLGVTKNRETKRQYFSDANGMRCDAIRQKIESWKKEKLINNNEYYFLLTSLIKSIDKCANTASVYGAFLKKLKKSAQKSFVLQSAELTINDQEHKVYNQDINKLTKKIKGDILYLDPPYNHRQYASNYHILETIAKYDNPKIHGKTGLRDYEDQKSLYCSRVEAKNAFKDLISKAKIKYIFLSYNNEGIMSLEDIKEIMSMRGEYGHFTKEYNRFKADKNRNYKADKTVEYLHYVICK